MRPILEKFDRNKQHGSKCKTMYSLKILKIAYISLLWPKLTKCKDYFEICKALIPLFQKKKRWSSISGLTLRITIWTYGAQNGSIPITAYMNNRINEYSEVVSIWFLQSALCIYYHIKIFKTLMIGQNQEIMCVIIEYPPFNKIK